MMVPGIVIALFYIGLILLVAGNFVDPVAALITALIGQFAAYLVVSSLLFRHQKLLEWFAKHINVNPKNLPPDAPDDLLDFWKDGDDKRL